jgi:hypothetical protein
VDDPRARPSLGVVARGQDHVSAPQVHERGIPVQEAAPGTSTHEHEQIVTG